MVLQLDPRFPLVWRSPDEIQVGLDDPVVVTAPSDLQLRVIDELVRGTTRTRLAVRAATARQDPAVVDALLERLRSRLLVPVPVGRWWVSGQGVLADRIRGTLLTVGQILDPDEPQAVVICRDWTVDPAAAQGWLSADIPQLPVVASDTSVTLGPWITPGQGPCLYCLHAYRVDRDPAWAAIACQLVDRPGTPDALLVERLAAEVTRLLVTPGGRRDRRRQWVHTIAGALPQAIPRTAHPRCLCRDSVATERVPA